jgi:carbonic anhydrase/acetyltransferase-like protein (isoleucine patch superfamily)
MTRTALAWLALTCTFASTALAQGGPQAVTPGGAVPVFVFAGQSNAVGVDTLDELRADQRAPQPKVLFYGPNERGNTWGVLTPSSNSPNLIDGLGRTGGSFGPEISAGKTISIALGGTLVAEVKLAVGATALFDRWNPTGGDLYQNMVARVKLSIAELQTQLGLTGYVAGFFWMQGESDALSDQFRDDYAANLRNFIASMRRDFNNPDLPFVFGQIIDFDHPISTPLRDQQQAVANDITVTHTAFILTDDLCHHDFIHFNGRAIYTLGVRFGAGYLSIVDVPPVAFISPTANFGCNPIIRNGTVINSGVSIGDDAEIGANVTLNKLVRAGDDLTIGDGTEINQGTTFGDHVTIGGNVTIGRNAVIGSGVVIGGNTAIGTGANIGDNAQIGTNVKVGASATVAANAVVPPGTSIGSKKTFP